VTKPRLGLVIVNWKQSKLTLETLFSLSSCRLPPSTLLVLVENGSADGSVEIFEEYQKTKISRNFKLILIKSSHNTGFAGGNNLGIKYLLQKNCQQILLLNNDTDLHPDSIALLLKAQEKLGPALLSPLIYFAPGFEFHADRYQKKDLGKVIWYAGGQIDWKNCLTSHQGVNEIDSQKYKSPQKTDFASGCCLLLPAKIFKKIGLFDERYFLYWEDVDLSIRAARAGFPAYLVPTAKIWHKNSGSSQVGGLLHDYFLTRNRLLFGFKYAPFRTRLSLLKESLKHFFKGRPWQKIAVKDYYLKNLFQGSWKK